MEDKKLIIDCVGALKLTDPTGLDVTPQGKKQKGIIAILCTSPNLSCSRAKLQDKLWSDRAQEQGSGSLRQALYALRQMLNTTAEIIVSNGDWVELNRDLVTVNLEPRGIYPENMLPEFAEGLDIQDPEFETWIRDQRTSFERQWQADMQERNSRSPYPYQRDWQSQRAEPTVIVIAASPITDPELNVAVQMILRDGAKRACSFGDFVIIEESETIALNSDALRISCLIARNGDRIILNAVTMVESSRRMLWNQTFECRLDELFLITNDVSEALTLALLKSGPSLMENEKISPDLPLGDIFGYSRNGLFSADNFLETADKGRERPIFLSFRAYVRHTMIVERVTDHPNRALAEADEMVAKAMERAPNDPFTLSVRSLISGLRGEEDLSLEFAQRAVQNDKSNAFARHSLSVALSFAGQKQAANKEAQAANASRLVMISPAIYYLQRAYTALGVGEEHAAYKYANMAHGVAPNFRPALRCLIALAFRKNDEKLTRRYIERLRVVEPDFSLELMREPRYPVNSLREANVLDVVNSSFA